MNSRERVLRAINFDYPDRPPISHAILPSTLLHYGPKLTEILQDVREDFGWDYLPDVSPVDFPPYYHKGVHTDPFGTVWSCSTDGEYGTPVEYPFSDWSAFKTYTWPDFDVKPPSTRLYSGHMCHPGGKARAKKEEGYYARGAWIQFFEQMQQLRGFTQVLMDLAEGSPEIFRLRDELLDYSIAYIDKWLEWDYDGLHFADDWGSQNSLLISPRMWRAFFKPVYARMFSRVIDAGVDVHFHSDGYVVDIIPDLIDLGAKVINVQTGIMDLDLLKRNYTGRICFRTDLDRQKVMSFGTPADVRTHIRDVFTHLGSRKGGIIACGEIGRDTPLDNIKAMYETFMNFEF
ncbi:uroporphyrinogen decarboxylase family protein [Salinispira pacifica]